MEIETSRFGKVTASEEDMIRFPTGIIGFRNERAFVLIPHGDSTLIGWLQSAATPELAFPVVSAHGLVDEYPDVGIAQAAESAPASAAPTTTLAGARGHDRAAPAARDGEPARAAHRQRDDPDRRPGLPRGLPVLDPGALSLPRALSAVPAARDRLPAPLGPEACYSPFVR